MRALLSSPVLLLVVLASASSFASAQSPRRRTATERITLVVEILDRDDTPTIPCGILGPQPRDVTARVVAVEEGTFVGDRILLSWPVCSLASITVGARYRIQVRRFAGVADTPETRFRVRRADPP